MRNFRYIFLIWVVALWAACEPTETDSPSLGTLLTSADVTFVGEMVDANHIKLTNTTPGSFSAIWDLGNGASGQGQSIVAEYPSKGDYTVTITAMTRNGQAQAQQVFNIATTNPLLLDIPEYNMLTGGSAATAGKTWIVDHSMVAHLALGDPAAFTPNWWSAGADEKADQGLYDDEMTFALADFKYTYDNKGKTFFNNAFKSVAGGTNGGSDATLDYAAPAATNWSLSKDGDNWFIQISKGGHIAYYEGSSRYQIMSITNDELWIRSVSNNIAWYQKLVRKGFERVKPVIPYLVKDIKDSFDGTSTVSWYTNEVSGFTKNYDNPAPLGINNSAKVLQYHRGEGGAFQWANAQIRLPYKMDLTQRHVFKLKIYMPSFNDYTTVNAPDWAAFQHLTKVVALKLQNGEAGEPWVSQAEIKADVTVLDKWVELTFDFAAFADRKDFDRVLLQIGGEGHFVDGIFYVDDLELMPVAKK